DHGRVVSVQHSGHGHGPVDHAGLQQDRAARDPRARAGQPRGQAPRPHPRPDSLRHTLRSLALLAFALAPLAGAQAPLGQGDLAAILGALGIREQPPGLTTVRLWWDGNGGYVDLPPRSAGSALCVTERHAFEGNASVGFRRFDSKPSYAYWQP